MSLPAVVQSEVLPRRPRHRRRRGRAPGPVLHRRGPRRDPLPRPGRQLRREGHRHPAAQRPDPGRRARLRTTGRHRCAAAVPVRRSRLRTPIPRDRVALALRVLGPVPARTHHRSQHARPASAPLPHRGHRRRLLPNETGPRTRRNPHQDQLINTKSGDFYLAKNGDQKLAVDIDTSKRTASSSPPGRGSDAPLLRTSDSAPTGCGKTHRSCSRRILRA